MDAISDAEAWDRRVDHAVLRTPAALQRGVAWLREPTRRWLRLGAGVLFILGGVLSILPVLGLWMLPLGLALIGQDSPPLKGWLERTTRRGEAVWRRMRPGGRGDP